MRRSESAAEFTEDGYLVRVVIDGCQAGDRAGALGCDAEGSAVVRIDGELRHKGAVEGVFHDLTGLIRIGVAAITVGDQQMTVRLEVEIEWTVQIRQTL